MLYPRQVAVLFAVTLFGMILFGIPPKNSAESREIPISVEDATSVAEGRLAEFSANGARFTLIDDVPDAQLKMRRLFNLAEENEKPAPKTREFVLSSRVPEVVDQFKPGQLLRVRYRIGNDPCVAVQVEACAEIEQVSDRIPSVREDNVFATRRNESRLEREIRWNLNEDTRLSVQARLISVQHDRRGIVLEGTVPTETEKMIVEEKVQRLTGGAGVLSKLRVEPRNDYSELN